MSNYVLSIFTELYELFTKLLEKIEGVENKTEDNTTPTPIVNPSNENVDPEIPLDHAEDDDLKEDPVYDPKMDKDKLDGS